MDFLHGKDIMSVMTGCIIRVAVSNSLVPIMVLIPVLKDIKVVPGGESVLHPSDPVLHRSAPALCCIVAGCCCAGRAEGTFHWCTSVAQEGGSGGQPF